MKIYFIRNTHDEKGHYRGDGYFGMIDMYKDFHNKKPMPPEEEWDKAVEFNRNFQEQELPFGVHVWEGSGEKLTFDQIYQRIRNLYIGGAYDGKVMLMPDDEKHTIPSILKALAFMVEKKLVKVEIIYD